jgi:hypothetical protein
MLQDQKIGHTTRAIGWIGMIASVLWLAWHVRQDPASN